MRWFKDLGAGLCTVAVFVALGLWLAVMAHTVGISPRVDASGKIEFDEFQRAKDILLALLPLATSSLGYWYGSKNTGKANDAADTANARADQAGQHAAAASAQLAAVLDQAPAGVLEAAKKVHPNAFAPPVAAQAVPAPPVAAPLVTAGANTTPAPAQ